MRIGEHRLREHIRLLAPILAFLVVVWVLRLVLAAAGTPLWLFRIASMTAATAVATLLAVVVIHARRFGGYVNVVVASLLINAWTELLIIVAILFSVATGIDNVYTAPEFSMPGDDPHHLRHIYGHLTFGIGIGTLVGAAGGCLLLWLLRMLLPPRSSRNIENEEVGDRYY